ncbi:MAG TPA: RNA polymerase subunit sigma-70 [Porphyromonadaceae bacterium]|nr:RNA polymerase subunit sigma-70 [Porphyromonadaceae bacterium]HBL33033.1 RNA polymerase subunit sigma-70 [Porphyromonadaceae bacterium]HBX20440.1 RNA polymerase subunit sigma-70 [Porphyromonadaceae bacterium]HCM19949.1 RNA polymerase subunit sigma-70 [Porphyromonadaceae bacterium]
MSMDITEYKRVVVALRPSMLAIARRITGNKEDAEDVVQEVCLKIWHRRIEFGEYRYENLEAYSMTMVKNLSIDKVRTRRPSSDETALLERESESQSPDILLEQKDDADALRHIIGLLPPLQQRILRLKDLEEYETAEIAGMTGIAVEAVRNNLSRARKQLRELYLLYYRHKKTEL